MGIYFALVQQRDDRRFRAEVPDFPCCIADGPSAEAAVANARRLVADRVAAMRDAAMPVPKGRSLPLAMARRSGRSVIKAVAIAAP
jgi:predicted RNase H-like HicB family nuclease